MNYTLLIPAITTAISIGLSCGATCSPVVTTFLTTYVISHSDGIKSGIKSFISFFFGKILSVSILCILSALISKNIINDAGYIGNINMRYLVQIFMSAIGCYLVYKWFLENKKNCKKCKSCGKDKKENKKNMPIFIAGLVYGFTPCAPLLLIIGYTFTLPVIYAGITGIVFGVATIISPIILLSLITGFLSKRMREEIPHSLKWFRLASYIVLIVMPIFMEIK